MRGSIRLIMEVDFYLDGLDDCDGVKRKCSCLLDEERMLPTTAGYLCTLAGDERDLHPSPFLSSPLQPVRWLQSCIVNRFMRRSSGQLPLAL